MYKQNSVQNPVKFCLRICFENTDFENESIGTEKSKKLKCYWGLLLGAARRRVRRGDSDRRVRAPRRHGRGGWFGRGSLAGTQHVDHGDLRFLSFSSVFFSSAEALIEILKNVSVETTALAKCNRKVTMKHRVRFCFRDAGYRWAFEEVQHRRLLLRAHGVPSKRYRSAQPSARYGCSVRNDTPCNYREEPRLMKSCK